MILWPEICAALANGQTLKTIRDWLEESGIVVTYSAFTSYVSRIRRRGITVASDSHRVSPASASDLSSGRRNPAAAELQESIATALETEQTDPLKNIRERSANRPGFEYPPGVDEDSLI
jgi:hypothetical protein